MTDLELATALSWSGLKIRALPTVMSAVHNQLYRDNAPQDRAVTYPFLLYSAASAGTGRGVGGVKIITPVILTLAAIDVPAQFSQLKTIMGTIDQELDNAPTEWHQGSIIGSCLRQNQVTLWDDDRYQRYVLTYRLEITVP